MRYTFNFNQKAISDNGWIGKIKFNHLAVLEAVVCYFGTDHIERLTDQRGDWYWVSNKIIVEEIPMAEISEDRCRQIISELCAVGLLERHPNNAGNKKTFLRKGVNYTLLFSDKGEAAKKLAAGEKNKQQSENIDNEAAKKLAGEAAKKLADNNYTNSTPYTNNNYSSVENKKEELDKVEKSYENFKVWLQVQAPNVLKMDQPITLEEYRRLLEEFNQAGHWQKIIDTLTAMHNTKGLTKKYVSANLTLRNWVKSRLDTKKSFQQKDSTGGFQVGNADYSKMTIR